MSYRSVAECGSRPGAGIGNEQRFEREAAGCQAHARISNTRRLHQESALHRADLRLGRTGYARPRRGIFRCL